MVLLHQNKILIGTIFSFFMLSFAGYLPSRFAKATISAEEICENAIDDDGDGLIDLNDPDCVCHLLEPLSLIPNPSFEDMNCCPVRQSQMDCAAFWIQASEATTDFIHMCDWMGWPDFPPPLPFPDGEGIMGFRDGRVIQESTPETNWKEYAGACLLSPLISGTTYIFEFYVGFVDRFKSPDINISFFGATDCANLPFGIGNEAFGCPTNGPGWMLLGSRVVSGGSGNKWVKTSIEVVPTENITAIAIGPDCPPVHSPISIYYFFDNLTLVDLRSFQFRITEVMHPCQEGFLLKVPQQSGFTYQWYKNGIALVGESSSQLMKMHGEGEYQVRVMNGGECSLTGIYTYIVPVINSDVIKTICAGDVYNFGVQVLSQPGFYTETFKNVNHCDSIVSLELRTIGTVTDTLKAEIFEGEIYKIGQNRFSNEGEYEAHLISSQGCDSIVLLQLEYYHIYIPNVFSPNGDGINDFFSVSGGEGMIEMSNLMVYDRWGNQIYNGSVWDGKRNDDFVIPGVFTYIATLRMSDGIERQFHGSVTMIK